MGKTDLSLNPFVKLSKSQIFRDETKLPKIIQKTNGPKKIAPKEWTDVYYKGYPKFNKKQLPLPSLPQNSTLLKCFYNRKSTRRYSTKPLTLKQLSTMLYFSGGLRDKHASDVGNRFYPSAGARYPHEIYPVIFNVEGLDKGIYHYHLKTHSLEYMWTFPDLKEKVCENFNQSWIEDSSVLFLISAIFWRTEAKYGNRGYRLLLIDTGHLSQNFYLISAALNIECCSIGGFIDDGLNKLLDLDGKEESIIITISVGVVGQ